MILRVLSLLTAAYLCACASSSGAAPSNGNLPHAAVDTGAARAQLEELARASSRYSFAHNKCPQSIDDLLHPPTGEPLIDAAPLDPWGHAIAFMPASEDAAANAFISAGPDGELLSADDITVSAPCSER